LTSWRRGELKTDSFRVADTVHVCPERLTGVIPKDYLPVTKALATFSLLQILACFFSF
jgi:hypothetical protein